MDNSKFTVTIVAAFDERSYLDLRASYEEGARYSPAGITSSAPAAHLALVRSASKWAAEACREAFRTLSGFTAVPTFGAGQDGDTVWPVEPGVQFTFAGLDADGIIAARGFATALKFRQRQQAVAFSVRAETFELI